MKVHALDTQLTVYTVGHSTHSLDDFFELLRAYSIERLVDVRTVPRSRHNPQFNHDTLGTFLCNRRIGYRHMKDLGGLRHARADSSNTGWHNASFRGFADYMQTPQFIEAVTELIELAKEKTTVIMCAEAVPWRCHRNLLSDALTARNIKVKHILTETSITNHELTPFAHLDGYVVTYPLFVKEKTQRTLQDFGSKT